ncbi:biotin--[acetyl-CoA-carboxylase] ligase [Qipengyuania sp.]|uniref:biotin--[acetyl-CoA-carboxylase] ligase n=1 Tax=Qipengyuania sp. TaxID=2004515 RepID=UPI0035C7C716
MIKYVSETGSTNADVIADLRDGVPLREGAWLVADRQKAGRGRQNRKWFDGSGNFMGSTMVRLHPGDPPPASLALVAGLALYESVVPLLPQPAPLRLKWPNDLTFSGAKLAGILLERQGDFLVIGIGVNLVSAPAIEGRETVALARLTAPPHRDAFAASLAGSLTRELDRWRSFGLEPLLNRWQAAAHEIGTRLNVQAAGEGQQEGTFAGLSDEGALQLRLADGTFRVIHAGDVFFAQREG